MDKQHMTPPRYTNSQPEKNSSQSSSFALISRILGIFSLVCFCFPPLQLILGGLAIMFALLSRQEDNSNNQATLGLMLGIVSCITSILIFWLTLLSMDIIKQDPEFIPIINTMMELLEQYLGPIN